MSVAFERLLSLLRALDPLCVALSGGVDSRFLVHAALLAGCDVLAVHAAGPHVPAAETEAARRWAAVRNVPFLALRVDPLQVPEVLENGRERCYFCKRTLMAALREATGTRTLCDGSNADDATVWRPGLRALREARVRSPLAEAGCGKAALRRLGAATGLERPDQRSRPCLLTRLAYGLRPDAALLARLEAAEDALRRVGLADFRLRLRPAPLLQTLPLSAACRTVALTTLADHGFPGAEVLEEEQVSGYFDRGASS